MLFNKNKPKIEKTVSAAYLWDVYRAQQEAVNLSSQGIIRNYNLYADFSKIYSGENNISYIYVIDYFPDGLTHSYKDDIRNVIKGDVNIHFIDNLEHHKINWDSRDLKATMTSWARFQDDYENRQLEDTKVDYNIKDKYKEQEFIQQRGESVKYFQLAEGQGRRTFVLRTMIIISGKRGIDFDTTVVNFLTKMNDMGFKFRRISGDLEPYLTSYFPTSKMKGVEPHRINGQLITDEIYSYMTTFSAGNISKGDMYFGSDLDTYLPILKTPKESLTDAENWIIVGQTGSGKSVLVKAYVIQLLARNNVVGTIMDIEGQEYTPIASLLAHDSKVVMLDLREGSGVYFDPVEILLVDDPEERYKMFSYSLSATKSIFNTLVGGNEMLNQETWIKVFISEGIQNFYTDLGVKANDPDTWHVTKGKTLFDVYDYIVNKTKVPNEVAQNSFDLLISLLGNYFDKTRNLGMFENRIVLDEIRDAKLVVFDFGLQGRATSTIDEVHLGLMMIYTAQIAHFRSVFSHQQNLINVKIWEEFPRWTEIEGSREVISTALVGGRKLGDINVIATNKPKDLLDNDVFGLFDSITTFALGNIVDSDVRRRLADRLGGSSKKDFMAKELERISDLSGKDELRTISEKQSAETEYKAVMENKYDKSFLISPDRRTFYLGKFILPLELATSSLFRTGVRYDTSDE